MEPIGKDSFVGDSVPPLKYCNPLYTPLAIKGRLQVFFIITVALPVPVVLAMVVLVTLAVLVVLAVLVACGRLLYGITYALAFGQAQ